MKTIAHYLFVFAVLGLCSSFLQAASFDCKKASSGVEQRICANKELSELDEQLSSEYRAALKVTADPFELRQSQRAWIREERDGCNDPLGRVHAGIDYCLKPKYKNRIIELRALRTPLDQVVGIYTKKNPNCSFAPDQNDDTQNIEVCNGFNEDRISIQKAQTGAIEVEMQLFFFNGHICTFEGSAVWKQGKLVAEDNEGVEDEPCTFELYSDGRHIITKNALQACSRHCGMRGSLAGVEATKPDRPGT